MTTPLHGMTPLSMLPVGVLQLQDPLYQLLVVLSQLSLPACGHRISFQEFSRCIYYSKLLSSMVTYLRLLSPPGTQAT